MAYKCLAIYKTFLKMPADISQHKFFITLHSWRTSQLTKIKDGNENIGLHSHQPGWFYCP